MNKKPVFFNPEPKKPIKVAGFMSGAGSNLRKLLELGSKFFEVSFIFTDKKDSAALALAYEYNLPCFIYDIRRFYETLQKPRRIDSPAGIEARKQYDQVASQLINAFAIDLIALGGYMSFLTIPLGGVNVHPADLSLLDEKGRRKYVGAQAVKNAILNGETYLKASTIWVDEGIDTGPLLLLSQPVPVELPCSLVELQQNAGLLKKTIDAHQEKLKKIGDWLIFPLTIELLAKGSLSINEQGVAYYRNRPYPGGISIEEIL